MPVYRRKITQTQACEILRMFYLDQVEVSTLALICPVAKSTLYAILQGRAYHWQGFDYDQFPYNRPPQNRKRTPVAIATARRMREEGATYRQIGEVLGVHLTTIRAWLAG